MFKFPISPCAENEEILLPSKVCNCWPDTGLEHFDCVEESLLIKLPRNCVDEDLDNAVLFLACVFEVDITPEVFDCALES